MLRRTTFSFLLAASLVTLFAGASLGASSTGKLHIAVPHQVASGDSATLKLRVPAGVAAVDGRVFIDTTAAELVGVSATGRGISLTPQQFNGGYAFGVYGMRTGSAKTLTIALASADGQLPYRVVLDAAADSMGNAVNLVRTTAAGSVAFGSAAITYAPAQSYSPRLAIRPAGATRDLVGDGRLAVTDIDVARAGWESAHDNNSPCGADTYAADANGDGCVDIIDVQTVLAHQSWTVANGVAVAPRSAVASSSGANTPLAVAQGAPSGTVFVVNTSADAVDAKVGDGICADSQGRCTLRAAITESNWSKGPNTIDFDISGTAPITITLSNSLPQFLLQDRTGGTLIDGYSQPGSKVNTSATASNATPGIYLVGTGNNPKQNGFRVTSADNTIRGFILNDNDRSIVLDGTDAHGNLIAGNWLNYNRDGSPTSYKGHFNVWISNGANHNALGSPALADRNVSGTATKGAAMYGPGTDYNTIQNNLFCMTPNGNSTATCNVGTDFSFGPKHNLIGGPDPADHNVYGSTTEQCIEFAHDNGKNTTDDWKNEYNSIVGNYLGFKPDGSYASSFRCGSNTPKSTSNDSNVVNLADGSSYNTVQGNWMAGWHDGVNIMSSNETGNVVQGNTIGVSPKGQAAPLDRYGINFRTHAVGHKVVGNTIRNTANYGIAINGADITHITLSQNVITDTTVAAINLVSGANGGIQPPKISTASTTKVTGTGVVGAKVEVFKASRASGKVGNPSVYVGTATVASNGTWSATISGIVSGDNVTATQTNAAGNTSALSTNVTAH